MWSAQNKKLAHFGKLTEKDKKCVPQTSWLPLEQDSLGPLHIHPGLP